MSKISAEQLILLFEQMLSEGWQYGKNKAAYGLVDCSGAFVYAFDALGGPSIEHGSNSIYRHACGEGTETPAAGYAAFKVRDDGQEPERYRKDGKGNFYHIGLVDASGNFVLNAKSVKCGFSRDPVRRFTVFAPLLGVDYGKGENTMETLYKAEVMVTSGSLYVRSSASIHGNILGKLEKGTVVEVLEEGSGWLHIRYGELEGWAASKYLHKVEQEKRWVITDSEGSTFSPVGGFTVEEVTD